MKVLSLFDGMGCGAIALKESSIPIDTYDAYEIDKYAIKVTQHNFPFVKQHGDVFKADFTQYKGVDCLIGGSPCFQAGTFVYTDKGYTPIESLKVGDRVLTHKNRFKPITNIGHQTADTVKLDACGMLPTIVTNNHPYFTREQGKIYNPSTKGMIKSLSSPEWKPVKDFNVGKTHLGVNLIDIEENPFNLTEEDCWILGRYVADGHCRISKRKERKNSYQYQLVLSIGSEKIDEFKSKVTHRHFSCYPHSKSVYRCVFSNMELCRFVVDNNFGLDALNKTIPPLILNLPKKLLQIFLEGYFAGDGCRITNGITCTTVSKTLALSLQLAIIKVYGINGNISVLNTKPYTIVEGRKVNQHTQYVITFKFATKPSTRARLIDEQLWTPVTKVVDNEKTTVYNISVADDESYTANNAIVHNCTYWSIAQKNNRETEASGLGWDLFCQYVRAIKEARPKYFLYENNKSMSNQIRKSINKTFGFEPIHINSALVSAQNRNRLYWVGKRNKDGTYSKVDIPQPKDKGILLRDIIDDGIVWQEKSYAYTTRCNGAILKDTLERHRHTMVAVPVGIGFRNRREADGNLYRRFESNCKEKSNAITTVKTDSMVSIPLGFATDCQKPIRIGLFPTSQGILSDSQGNRIYSLNGKSVTQSANGGGWGAKTGLYALPLNWHRNVGGLKTVKNALPSLYSKYGYIPEVFNAYNCKELNKKSPTQTTGSMATSSNAVLKFERVLFEKYCNDKNLYFVYDGKVQIKNKKYPIKLSDGWYIIRKLTVAEAMRLQTIPEWYDFSAISDSQAYKCIGNGWTVNVIRHLMKYIWADYTQQGGVVYD